MQQNIHVILIEDHPEYREIVGASLAKEKGLNLAGIYGSAERALRKLEYPESKKETIDIILLDLNLPGMSGLEAIPWIKKAAPLAKIIVLSQSNAEADVVKAIQLSASGYLLKSSTIEQIAKAIHCVAEGGAMLDPHVAKYILRECVHKTSKIEIAKPLSKRELEVLEMLAEGLQKKEIAGKLGISTNTIVKHIVHIYEKLGVQNAPAAINKAYQAGILNQ